MNIFIGLNIAILGCLLLFLFKEELRFRQLARRVKETKEELTMIVHQLRSPLSNLRKYNGFLQVEEFGTLSFAQQEAIGKAQTALGESLVLLDRLLARSHLDESDVGNEPASVAVRSVVQGAVDAVMSIADRKKQKLNISGGGKAAMFIDPILLHGILDEILSNALHYTPEGGTITVNIEERRTNIVISVTDTGIGISAEERPHIFEKFFRGERAKPMFGGNGLGLSFAKLFTLKLNGSIDFTSTVGKGSTFIISIPKKTRPLDSPR